MRVREGRDGIGVVPPGGGRVRDARGAFEGGGGGGGDVAAEGVHRGGVHRRVRRAGEPRGERRIGREDP